MNLPTETFGNVVVLHTPEELSEDSTVGFEAFVSQLAHSNIVVDLDGTETIDSIGLESIVACQRTLREMDGDLKIATTNATNRKILEITRLDDHFEVFGSVVDAVKSFC